MLLDWTLLQFVTPYFNFFLLWQLLVEGTTMEQSGVEDRTLTPVTDVSSVDD